MKRKHQKTLEQIYNRPTSGNIPWKDIVGLSGPMGLRKIKGFHDESLRGEWKGHRSSRLGLQYRVIYKALKDQVMIQVVNLSPHDYRKK